MSEISRQQLNGVLGLDLSNEQWQIISSPLEPSVVVAGAGSGKTTSMAARVAWLVGSGWVDADAVLGLTFTNKAAASLGSSMRRMLNAMDSSQLRPLSDDEFALAAEPQVQTYNAFAARILSDHGIRIGREPGARLLTDGARQQLAYSVVCTSLLPLDALEKNPDSIASDLLRLDDQCSELDLDPASLMQWDQALVASLTAVEPLQNNGKETRQTAAKRILLAQLIQDWRAAKLSREVIDYSDQTRLALELVRSFPDVAAEVREQFAVVLLDEYQDTSIAQRHLLQALFGEGHPVTAVGDPCQAIYGWRGASVDNIENFPHHFPASRGGQLLPAARYTLSANRRSGHSILAIANELSHSLRAQHTGLLELQWADTGKGAGDVAVGLFEHISHERSWIVDRIRQLGAVTDQRWGDIAILATTGKELAAFATLLTAADVPVQLHGAAGLLSKPLVVEVRAVLEAVVDPIANPAVVRLLAGPRWAIGPRDLAALGVRAVELAGSAHRVDAQDVGEALDEAVAGADGVEMTSLSDATFDLGDLSRYSPQAAARLHNFGQELAELRRHSSDPPVDFLGRILATTGLDVELALATDDAQLSWMSFVRFAAEFTDLEGRSTLSAFLRRLRDAERFDVDLSVDVVQRADAVQLMTVFKAKGLEFAHVFVPGFVDGAFPGGNARGQWPSSAVTVPWHLRADATDALRSYPRADESPRAKDYRAYLDELRALQQIDSERLAYVALTRAQHTLIVTGHWWGTTQKGTRDPAPYLGRVGEASQGGIGNVVIWEPKPEDAVNPFLLESQGVLWPAPVASTALLQSLSADIADSTTVPPLELSEEEQAQVSQWEATARVLVEEVRLQRQPVVRVPLPASLSASQLMRAMSEPASLARDLARPMPSATSVASARGTAMHAWIETQYGQQSLLDPDDLPGSADVDIASDEALDELKEAFSRSAFANRQPFAIEQAFAMVLGGRVVRGRIDAVFESNGRFDVIDWKTGIADHVDAWQLALYRLAWSRIAQVPLEHIDAGFLMIRTGELLRPVLPDLSELIA
ncbi:MAG: ATP-dependent DNA helicase [Actinomycetota bacterium]|nr:ATP-dependent DNA helicase [Actinomycetota bacterium]